MRERTGNTMVIEEGQLPGKKVIQDFKMVTFSLGGKDYGIDIMKVKEIAKYAQFTYVPNTPPYVRGVYNLRGEIISIVDLRIFFHLPVEKKINKAESGLILRLEDYIIGVIVDSIDKVVSISSEDIQLPHPIFGDINLKYISGVVEHDGTLYLILDAESLFGKEQPISKPTPIVEMERAEITPEVPQFEVVSGSDQTEKDFIRGTLKTFKSFYVSPVNEKWVDERFAQWREERSKQGKDLQLKSVEEADEFLKPFYSPYTEAFWPEEIEASFLDLFKDFSGRICSVWNPGCGKGHETYSVAGLFLKKFPDCILKVWAMDSDLLAISTAPNLMLTPESIPNYLRPYTVRGKNGIGFSPQFKDRIYFEYHDIQNINVIPECDLIVARDLISFLPFEAQQKVLEEFYEKLKPKGILILGNHEELLDKEKWRKIENKDFNAFQKNIE
jgi:purine-binding chemotaxis protein CheW